MRELNLSEQYALIALEGQESLHRSVAKSAVLRAVTAAEVLMPVLEKEGCSLSEFAEEAEKAVQAAKNMNKKKERQIEQKVKESLEKEGLLCEIPDLLGCDLNYYSSGIELKSYRSDFLNIMSHLSQKINCSTSPFFYIRPKYHTVNKDCFSSLQIWECQTDSL